MCRSLNHILKSLCSPSPIIICNFFIIHHFIYQSAWMNLISSHLSLFSPTLQPSSTNSYFTQVTCTILCFMYNLLKYSLWIFQTEFGKNLNKPHESLLPFNNFALLKISKHYKHNGHCKIFRVSWITRSPNNPDG